jgi:hypothetical protein
VLRLEEKMRGWMMLMLVRQCEEERREQEQL